VASTRPRGRELAVDRILVLGGSGRIGRYVLRELRAQYDVINADLSRGDQDVEFVALDVTDLERVRSATRGVDAVCHLAGLDLDAHAPAAEYIRVNALGSWNVLQAAAEAGVKKAVMMSSVAACGLPEMRPDWTARYLPVDEAHESRPVHAYSVSKRILEEMGLSFARGTSLHVVCFRAVAVVSPETLSDYVAFVEEPGRRWLFYYVTAEDVARAFRLALEAEGPRYGTFFLSAADTSRAEPTLEWYAERVGPLPQIVDRQLYDADQRATVFTSEKARDVFGWRPTSSYLDLRARLSDP
jgi:nucleoside-diphosphate-sugar epimerase